NGYYVLPTIFENVDGDARIAKEEIFGPVICLFKVSSYEAAVSFGTLPPYSKEASSFPTSIIDKTDCCCPFETQGPINVSGF
ncbi:aldehyde dehydrogenase family protein, partial [Bacillus paranthracis]